MTIGLKATNQTKSCLEISHFCIKKIRQRKKKLLEGITCDTSHLETALKVFSIHN